jgi:hypothetical protein
MFPPPAGFIFIVCEIPRFIVKPTVNPFDTGSRLGSIEVRLGGVAFPDFIVIFSCAACIAYSLTPSGLKEGKPMIQVTSYRVVREV